MPERNRAIWSNGVSEAQRRPLGLDLDVDVCVIGAGIAGLTTAFLLAREGRAVAVLDDGPIGGGQTGRTSAHLSNAIDDRYLEIERIRGVQGARIAAATSRASTASSSRPRTRTRSSWRARSRRPSAPG
jgi:glycine/D-amino acid oxidase-like deaminating enzyme